MKETITPHKEERHHSDYFESCERILAQNQAYIQRISPELTNAWTNLLKRRPEITSRENPASGMYFPFWFAEAFPQVDERRLQDIEKAHVSMYIFNVLFDDLQDLKQSPEERIANAQLAREYYLKATKEFQAIMAGEKGLENELKRTFQRYFTNEKRSVNRTRESSVVDVALPNIQEYQDTCILLQLSGSILSHDSQEPDTWEKLKRAYKLASIGAMHLDNIVDFERDLRNRGRTKPIYGVLKALDFKTFPEEIPENMIKVLKEVILYTGGIAEQDLNKSKYYLERARNIFEETGCESWRIFTEKAMMFSSQSI